MATLVTHHQNTACLISPKLHHGTDCLTTPRHLLPHITTAPLASPKQRSADITPQPLAPLPHGSACPTSPRHRLHGSPHIMATPTSHHHGIASLASPRHHLPHITTASLAVHHHGIACHTSPRHRLPHITTAWLASHHHNTACLNHDSIACLATPLAHQHITKAPLLA